MKNTILCFCILLFLCSCNDEGPEPLYKDFKLVNNTDYILSMVVKDSEITLPDSIGIMPGESREWQTHKDLFSFLPYGTYHSSVTFYLNEGEAKKTYTHPYTNVIKNPLTYEFYQIKEIHRNKRDIAYMSTYVFDDVDVEYFEFK